MDDNRRNYDEQEGDYFGKRYNNGRYYGGGDNRVNPERPPFGAVGRPDQQYNQAPVYNQNMNRPQYNQGQQQVPQMPPQGQMPMVGQQMPQQQMPLQMPPQGYNTYMQQGQAMQQGQVTPFGGQPLPFGYMPSNQYYMQPYNEQKKKSGLFSRGKKTLEEDFNDDMRNVIITYPKTFTDLQTIIDGLRSRQAIIVDLTRVNGANSQRSLDYLSGAIYALGGSQQRIADNMFLFTPDGVSIQGPSDLKRRYD